MQLLISNEQKEAGIGEELCSLIRDALEEVLALEEAGSGKLASRLSTLTPQLEVSLTLVDDARMAALNQQYRGLAGTTDVLSFPMDLCEVSDEEWSATSKMELLLGDIVISVPRALSQAVDYDNSFTQEMVFLAVHGMLHLIGYDDEIERNQD